MLHPDIQNLIDQFSAQFADGQANNLIIVVGIIGISFGLVLLTTTIVCFWLIFEKAGRAGWLALIPFVNVATFLQIAGKPWWYLLIFLIPFINIIYIIATYIDFARAFGKSVGFGVALAFFPFIFSIVLAFDSSQYTGLQKRKPAPNYP